MLAAGEQHSPYEKENEQVFHTLCFSNRLDKVEQRKIQDPKGFYPYLIVYFRLKTIK